MANEKRLIDANEAMEYAQKVFSDPVLLYAIKTVLDNAPTVEAVEVVHGRCVYVRDDEFIDHWECSVCGKYIPWEYHRDWNYCPNCGSKNDFCSYGERRTNEN